MARVKTREIIINSPLPEDPTRSTPALGTVDRLLKQSLLETQSLTVVRGLILRDVEQRAMASGPRKLLAAAGMRNGHANGDLFDAPPQGRPFKRKVKGHARRKEEAAKTEICGPRLLLFLLEHLDEQEYRTNEWMMGELHKTGLADHLKRLSGVWGILSTSGYLHHDKAKGYRRTAKGRKYMVELRDELEATGRCIKGQYLAPQTYSTKRGYVKQFQQQQHAAHATH